MSDVSKPAAKIAIKKRKAATKKRSFWRRVFYALIILILIICLAVWALWINRDLVIEEGVRRYLTSKGFESELEIESLSDRQAVITNIDLSHDGQHVFSAQKLTARYLWPDVKSGKLLSLDLEAPVLSITVDESATIINAWMPESSGGEGVIFPPEGVSLSGFKADVKTPLGILDLDGDFSAASLHNFDLSISAQETELAFSQVQARLSAQIDLKRREQAFIFEAADIAIGAASLGQTGISPSGSANVPVSLAGTLTLPVGPAPFIFDGAARIGGFDLAHPLFTLTGADTSYEGRVDYTRASKSAAFDGELSARAQALTTAKGSDDGALAPYLYSDALDLSFKGRASQSGRAGVLIDGALEINSARAGLSEPSDSRALARKIAMHETLAITPIAQEFHNQFSELLHSAFSGAGLAAALDVNFTPLRREIGLTKPLVLTPSLDPSATKSAAQERITITPVTPSPLLSYNANEGALDMRAHVKLSGAQDLTLSDLSVSGSSDDGWLWSDVERVSADIGSQIGWQNERARLGPFMAVLDYKAGRDSVIGLSADIDYDGPLLGYEFTGLRTRGDLSVQSSEESRSIYFATKAPVEASHVDSPLGWEARDLRLTLAGEQPLHTARSGPQASTQISLDVSDVSMVLVNNAQDKIFNIAAQAAAIKGVSTAKTQGWDLSLQGLDLGSDTTPSEGSFVRSESLDLSLSRALNPEAGNSDWTYDLKTPAMDADMAQLKLRDTAIIMTGTGDDFTVDYSGGTASIEGTALPALPVSGRAVSVDGAMTGAAKTALPQAPQYPVFLTFFYEDGIGGGDLNIPEFVFSPSGVQPATLAPVLKGKVAEVSGLASARVKLGYRAGAPITSEGTITLKDMDIGTLAGPFAGVNTTLNFSSLVPLRSFGTQTVTMAGFNAGLPLGAGTMSFDVVEGGILIKEARWPLTTGSIYIEPTKWSTQGEANRVLVKVVNVSLGELIAQFGKENLSATGQVNGQLPIVIDGVKVEVENGTLSIKDGGVIRVQTEGLDAAGESNDTAKLAIDALKEFEYDELSLAINGPLDGDMLVGAVFQGKNKDVLGGAEFLFRVNIEGELVNIAKNFANNTEVAEYLRIIEEELR